MAAASQQEVRRVNLGILVRSTSYSVMLYRTFTTTISCHQLIIVENIRVLLPTSTTVEVLCIV